MPPPLDLEKITLYIYSGDRERLQHYYQHTPYSVMIRELIRRHLSALDKQAAAIASKIKPPTAQDLLEDTK
jgi:hypothetical protein